MLYRWKEQVESQLKGKSLSVEERLELGVRSIMGKLISMIINSILGAPCARLNKDFGTSMSQKSIHLAVNQLAPDALRTL